MDPLGGGTRWTMASRISWTPIPCLALQRMASRASRPMIVSIWADAERLLGGGKEGEIWRHPEIERLTALAVDAKRLAGGVA